MKIKIISLRKSDSVHIRALEDDYIKRIKRYCHVELIDIKRSKVDGNSAKHAKEDAKKVCARIARNDFTIMLSDKGKELNSEGLAHIINKKMIAGVSGITFIIGGPVGLSSLNEVPINMTLSLSRLTLPHKLARLLLIEAVYRSFDIVRGGPYHK